MWQDGGARMEGGQGGAAGGASSDARWDIPIPLGRGSWADQMSEMSLSGRDSLPQEGGRNARVRRAVRISSLVAQEVSNCVSLPTGFTSGSLCF